MKLKIGPKFNILENSACNHNFDMQNYIGRI